VKTMTSSRIVAYALLLASTTMLVACGEKPVETALVGDPKSCPTLIDQMKSDGSPLTAHERAGAITKCELDYQAALAAHNRNAPAFNTQADCEQNFDKCAPTTATHATGSGHFMPLMVGYMLGSMMNQNSMAFTPQAAYHSRSSNGYVNSSGVQLGNSLGKTQFSAGSSALATPPVRTTTLKRNGWGVKSPSNSASKVWSPPKTSSSKSWSSSRSSGYSSSRSFSRGFSS
jgi:uncharacterized protein YgiB involved in biofilm formation